MERRSRNMLITIIIIISCSPGRCLTTRPLKQCEGKDTIQKDEIHDPGGGQPLRSSLSKQLSSEGGSWEERWGGGGRRLESDGGRATWQKS